MARSCSNSGLWDVELEELLRSEAVSEVLIVVSSLWEMPSVEERTADFTKERLMIRKRRLVRGDTVNSEVKGNRADIKAEAVLYSFSESVS